MDRLTEYARVLKIKEPHNITKYPFNVKNITRTLKKIELNAEESKIKGGSQKNSKKIIVLCI